MQKNYLRLHSTLHKIRNYFLRTNGVQHGQSCVWPLLPPILEPTSPSPAGGREHTPHLSILYPLQLHTHLPTVTVCPVEWAESRCRPWLG